MPLYMVEQDIVKMQTDAIVNSANTGLVPGGGACGAIFAAAGFAKLDAACREIGSCPLGGAVITPGFKLPAKYVIHVAGPIWKGGQHQEADLLASCYEHALVLALEHGCRSIAFPLISTGIYNYPKQEALNIAIATIRKFLREADLLVYLVVYDRFKLTVSDKLKISLDDYLSKHYEQVLEENENLRPRYRQRSQRERTKDATLSREEQALAKYAQADSVQAEVEENRICSAKEIGESFQLSPLLRRGKSLPWQRQMPGLLPGFSETLFKLINERGVSQVKVYQDANLDRKLFSKIRKDKLYRPSKATAVSLALALHLSIYDAEDLLARAGYAFSPAEKADVIVQYCFENKIYDIIEVNEILNSYGEKPFGPA